VGGFLTGGGLENATIESEGALIEASNLGSVVAFA
jgi:hypothetical protein